MNLGRLFVTNGILRVRGGDAFFLNDFGKTCTTRKMIAFILMNE